MGFFKAPPKNKIMGKPPKKLLGKPPKNKILKNAPKHPKPKNTISGGK